MLVILTVLLFVNGVGVNEFTEEVEFIVPYEGDALFQEITVDQ